MNLLASLAVEVVGVEAVALVFYVVPVLNDCVTLMTHVLPSPGRLLQLIALPAQSPTSIAQKTNICEHLVAELTGETFGVPVGVHRLDHAADDEVVAFVAAWGV